LQVTEHLIQHDKPEQQQMMGIIVQVQKSRAMASESRMERRKGQHIGCRRSVEMSQARGLHFSGNGRRQYEPSVAPRDQKRSRRKKNRESERNNRQGSGHAWTVPHLS
jgi:hypothetical protein